MSATGIRTLDRQINVVMDWIIDADREFGWNDRVKTYQALGATLRALRDRLTSDEAADLAAQLPIVLRGVFYEGYQPAQMPHHQRDVQQFLDGIRQEFQQTPIVDAEMIAKRVFAVLSRRVSAGQIQDVRGMLPMPFQYLWPDDSAMPRHAVPPPQPGDRPQPRAN